MNHVSTSPSEFCPPWVEPPQTIPTGLQLLATMRGNRLLSIPASAYEEPIVSGRTALRRLHILMAPEALRHVLQDRVEDYVQPPALHHFLRFIGNSIVLASERRWKRQRRAISPSFTPRSLTSAKPEMIGAINDMLARLQSLDPCTDVYLEARDTSFDIIARMIAGPGSSFDSDRVAAAIDAYVESAMPQGLMDYLPWPVWLPQPRYLRVRRHVRDLHRAAQLEIDRYNDGSSTSFFIEKLSDTDQSGTRESLSSLEIRDNILATMIAGHKTTASTLAWLLYLLARAPEVQEAARSEILSVVGPNCRDLENVPGQLPLCRTIIDETMRLYPAAPLLSRQAVRDDTIMGRKIKRGDLIILGICATHRHKLYWDEPQIFKPERFATPPKRFQFLPFGGGPRVCVGASMAYMELELAIAALLFHYRLHATEQVPEPVSELLLHPKDGIHLRLERLTTQSSQTQHQVVAPSDTGTPTQATSQD